MIKWKENLRDNITFMEVFLIGNKAWKKNNPERRKKSHSPKLFTSLASRFRQIVVLLQSLHEQSETGLIYK